MRRRATTIHSKGLPPYFGRQIRQRCRAVGRLFAFIAPGTQMRVHECPRRFQRVLRKVFQGIQAGKDQLALTVAHMFNKALEAGNEAIHKFLSLGLQAVACKAVGHLLVLELRAVGQKSQVITLRDEPAAFVAR
jgi:hypothetical protein